MTNLQFRQLLSIQHSQHLQSIHTHRNTPSRRSSKSNSVGDMSIQDKRFAVKPDVGLESQPFQRIRRD